MAGRPIGTGGKAEELNPKQIRRLDRYFACTTHEHRNRALFYLGLGSGMRISEVVGLRVKDVMPHGDVLERIVLEKHGTKSKRSRTVSVSRQAQKYLRTYLETRNARLLDPLFPSQQRPCVPMTTSTAMAMLTKAFDETGVSNASSHSLRRTHANTLRRNGIDLHLIQAQLGHASLSTTARYFTIDPAELDRAVGDLKF